MNEIINLLIDNNKHKIVYINYQDIYYFKSAIDNNKPGINISNPVPVYIRNEFLKLVYNGVKEHQQVMLLLLWRYYEFLFSYHTIDVLTSNIDPHILNDRLIKLLSLISKDNDVAISNSNELRTYLKNGLDYYRESYLDYIETNKLNSYIEKLPIKSISTKELIPQLRNALGMEKHFAIILDCYDDLHSFSQKTINNYLGSKCNQDLSLNILCKPNTWQEYYKSSDNSYIYNFEDYMKLDFSLEKKLIKKYKLEP